MKFELAAGEDILHEEKGLWIKNQLAAYACRLVVTDRRLAILVLPWWALGLGLIGELFAKPSVMKVELARASFGGIQPSTYGRAKNVVELRAKEGGTFKYISNVSSNPLLNLLQGWDQTFR